MGYAVGIGCLYWLFHNLPFRQFVQSLAGVDWWILGPAVLLSMAAYLCVAWEWQFLLRPVGIFSFWPAAQAVFAGRFANDALPLHVGYLVRAFLASRWMRASLAAMAPSLMMERLWDGFWLAVGIGALSVVMPLPAAIVRSRNILVGVVAVGIALTTAVVVWRGRRPAPLLTRQTGFMARIKPFLDCVAGGMRDIVRAHILAPVLFLSLLKLVIQAALIIALLKACHIELSTVAGLAVFVIGYLALCVPATPAGLGLYQVFVVAILGYFGVSKPEAASFSLLSFIGLTLPPALTGFFALAGTGLTLRGIRGELQNKNKSAGDLTGQ